MRSDHVIVRSQGALPLVGWGGLSRHVIVPLEQPIENGRKFKMPRRMPAPSCKGYRSPRKTQRLDESTLVCRRKRLYAISPQGRHFHLTPFLAFVFVFDFVCCSSLFLSRVIFLTKRKIFHFFNDQCPLHSIRSNRLTEPCFSPVLITFTVRVKFTLLSSFIATVILNKVGGNRV